MSIDADPALRTGDRPLMAKVHSPVRPAGTEEAKNNVTNEAAMRVLELFHEYFSIPLPESMLPPPDAQPLEGMPHLIGTPSARERPVLVQGDVPGFPAGCPEGYYLMGFWGHGVNSYAFYYVRVDERRQVLMRLPYGGIYMDNDRYAREIRDLIEAYVAFERSVLRAGGSLRIVEAMDHGRYEVVVEGSKKMVERSLLGAPDLTVILKGLVPAPA